MIKQSVHPSRGPEPPEVSVPLSRLAAANDAQLEATCAQVFSRLFGATARLRERFRRNDLFFQQRHWELADPGASRSGLAPVTPILFATIDGIHADIVDAYPDAVILGETADDAPKAAVMTDLLRFIRSRRRYRRVWRDWSLSLLVYGAALQEVFWDKSLLGGLGDVNVQHVSARNFLWNPAAENIQDSEAVIKVCFKPAMWIEARYPDAGVIPSGIPCGYDDFRGDERADGADDRPAMIAEMWWKQFGSGGNAHEPRVYMARFAGGRLLERFTDQPVYEHGLYPFVMTGLVPVEGRAWGLGLPDIYGDMQSTVDRLDRILLENAEMSSRVKMLVGTGAQINEGELLDWSSGLVHGERIDEAALRWFQPKPLSPYTMALMQAKIDAMKEESGQNAFVRGEGGKSVTAASAIMALQEAGSKRSRSVISKLYDAVADVTDMMIRLIAENYTEKRTFLIAGSAAREQSASAADTRRGGGPGGETPIEFSVSVHVQKQVPYKSVYNDERVMQLLRMGAVSPRAAVGLMDFERRDEALEAMEREDARGEMFERLLAQNVRQRAQLGEPVPPVEGLGEKEKEGLAKPARRLSGISRGIDGLV